jgi:hypothetical protein
MTNRVDCQTAGTDTSGHRCIYWDSRTLSCEFTPKEDQQPCVYQLDPGFSDEDLERREEIGMPADIQQKIRQVRDGVARIDQLWTEEVFRSAGQALDIMAKYRPGDPKYLAVAVSTLPSLNTDIIHLTALGATISVMVGEAMARFKELDAFRSKMHADKYMAVKASYVAGLRRGKPTDKMMDYHVRVDSEYSAAVDATLKAERQALVLKAAYEGLIELVNALKYQISSLQEEYKYAGRR